MLEEGMLSVALLGAGWVLWLLVGLSVACIAVSLDRWVFFRKDSTDQAALSAAVNGFLSNGDKQTFSTALGNTPGFEARILASGLEVAELGAASAEKAMSGVAAAEKLKMERGLALLATVGSNAPFLGLFGTVLGIIQAFADLALDTEDAQAAVMAGISEALVATAFGLLVAIPAVVLYNGFSRAVKTRLGRAESLADLVLARLTGPEPVLKEVAHGG